MVRRVAGATDEPAPAKIHARADALLHLGLVPLREHDDRSLSRCEGELLDNNEQTRRPTKDHHVPGLDHETSSPTEAVESLLDSRSDSADQRSRQENAAKSHEQREDLPNGSGCRACPA